MPSDHAQFMTLLSNYLTNILNDYKRFNWGKHKINNNKYCILLVWFWSFIVIYSRYYLGFHTILQLFIGILIGYILSIFMYKMDKQLINDNHNDIFSLD